MIIYRWCHLPVPGLDDHGEIKKGPDRKSEGNVQGLLRPWEEGAAPTSFAKHVNYTVYGLFMDVCSRYRWYTIYIYIYALYIYIIYIYIYIIYIYIYIYIIYIYISFIYIYIIYIYKWYIYIYINDIYIYIIYIYMIYIYHLYIYIMYIYIYTYTVI